MECLRRPSLWNHVVVSTKLLLAAFLAIAGARLIFDSTRLTRFSVVGGTIALIGLGSTLCLTTIHRGMETALALMLLVFAVDPLILNKHLSRSRGITLGGRPQAALLVTILFVAGTCAGLPSRCAKPTTDDEYVLQAAREVTTTRGIYDLRRCLPKLHQVYHSEIGVPGLIFPTARVVDLGGLMSKEVMLDRLPFDEICGRDLPEAIFLPHRNYSLLNREILRCRCIQNYTRVLERSSSPLFIRNDLVAAFRGCALDLANWQ